MLAAACSPVGRLRVVSLLAASAQQMGALLARTVFDAPRDAPRFPAVFGLCLLFLLGALHWGVFFDWGRGSYALHDWPEFLSYYDVWQQALQTGAVPWHVAPPLPQGPDRFLGSPEVPLTPQLAFLVWLDAETFTLANTLLLYSVGFLGCVRLRQRYGLSLFAFAVLWMIVNFNGHITAHLAVGHLSWLGYFLLPHFCEACLALAEVRAPRSGIRIGVILAAMLLQGAFHVFNWCLLLLVSTLLFRPALARALGLALLTGIALGACRLVPAALAFGPGGQRFMSGYPTASDVLAALVLPHAHDAAPVGGFFWHIYAWELDLYVGVAGLCLLGFGIARMIGDRRERAGPPFAAWRALHGPLLVLAFLALGDCYAPMTLIPVPPFNAERVATRFLVVPVLFVTVIATIHLQAALRKTPSAIGGLALGLGALVLLHDLMQHSRMWAPSVVAAASAAGARGTRAIAERPDLGYQITVGTACLATLLAAGAIWWLARTRRADQAPGPEPAT